MSNWQLLKTPQLSGRANMQLDVDLFNKHEQGLIPSTVRLYSWQPKCLSLGYSQTLSGSQQRLAGQLGWDVITRPTGGGIVFHNEAEVTYSLVTDLNNPRLPAGLVPSYKKISAAIVRTLGYLGVAAEVSNQKDDRIRNKPTLCFSYPAEYEVVVGGKKIVGSAQKRGKKTLLQQGSIFVRQTDREVYQLVDEPQLALTAISLEEVLSREIGFDELAEALIKGLENELAIKFN